MRVLAFDIGLRNLAAVVISQRKGFTFADLPQFKTYASPEETADEFKARALHYFLMHGGWELEQWDLIDVSEVLDRDVKNIKRLSDVSKAVALADSLQALEDRWFMESAPDIVCVETQHNANAIMRGVGMGTLVFFRRSFPETVLESKSGSHKLKICDALGVGVGDGLVPGQKKKAIAAEKQAVKQEKKNSRLHKKEGGDARWSAPSLLSLPVTAALNLNDTTDSEMSLAKEPAAAAAASPATIEGGAGSKFRAPRRFKCTGKKKEKYEDNKVRAVLAMGVLMPEGHAVLRQHSKKQDDLCDVLLMALWVLWSRVSPRAPVRRKASKVEKS